MPYRNLVYRQKAAQPLSCNKCNNIISVQQSYFECDHCNQKFHPKCKNLLGANINRRHEDNITWFCSDECRKMGMATPRHEPAHATSLTQMPDTNTIVKQNPVLSNVKISLDDLTTHLENVLVTVMNLRNVFNDLQKSQVELKQREDVCDNKIVQLTQENEELRAKINASTDSHIQQTKVIKQMEFHMQKLESMAQKEVSNNIIITGIPNVSIQPNTLIYKVIETLQAAIAPSQVEKAKYLEVRAKKCKPQVGANQMRRRHVYLQVTFGSNSAKQELLSKYRNRNQQIYANEVGFIVEAEKNLYIREQLTYYKSNLFQKARVFKNNNNYKHLWVRNHKIFLKQKDGSPVFVISSPADLEEIKK